MKRRFVKLCSIALTLVMLLQMLPLSVFAAEQPPAQQEAAAQSEPAEVSLVGELPQGRGEYTNALFTKQNP